jgi:hypothetical protein
MNHIAAEGTQRAAAEFADGFWADHWTYNLDLLENYLKVFAEEKTSILYEQLLPYFQSPNTVQPRSKKYILLRDTDGVLRPRQIGAQQYDNAKAGYIDGNQDKASKRLQRESQTGRPFLSTLAAKLVLLTTIKFATLDPSGMGVEQEAGKPGWLDALNGLPALFGSGMPETFEIQRSIQFLQKNLDLKSSSSAGRSIQLPAEFVQLVITPMLAALSRWNDNKDDFAYWDTVSTAREV